MMVEITAIILVTLSMVLCGAVYVGAATDPSDVQALQVLYGSLNNPSQLSRWKPNGGDPCEESWKGIACSGSSIVSIHIPGLDLNGSLGYLLSNLLSLRTLDVSNNRIHDQIPYQLPPNLTYLNLAKNNLTGNLPYSISAMVSLNYLNASHNSLSQTIGDLFMDLQDLSVLDLSFNNLTGVLPNSFSSLSNLSSLFLENNSLTGPVGILSNLDMDNLNIANNHFTGWIPHQFSSISNLRIEGNSFDNGPAPPPPPHISAPPGRFHSNHNHTRSPRSATKGPEGHIVNAHENKINRSSMAGPIVGIVLGSVSVSFLAAIAVVFCVWSNSKTKGAVKNTSKEFPAPVLGEWHQFSNLMSSHTPTEWSRAKDPYASNPQSSSSYNNEAMDKRMQEVVKISASMTSLQQPLTEKTAAGKLNAKNGSLKRQKSPITATSYTVASLQAATNSFSQECLVGEGSLGHVYRAEYSDGKVLAVKKIDSAALSLQEEDNFLEAISNMSRFRHANIVTLIGYCVEHGQRLLIHEYIGNGTLHDILHFADDRSKTFTWNVRVRVALGTARALEYLHEVCLPYVVHRNLKSANILLDKELNPFLSDCGLAALTPNTERQVSTQMIGSFGYSAPEFAMSGVYTVKSDVYSFGVVMLELLTGRKALDSSRVRSEQSLVRWATPQLHDIDSLARMVDPALNGMYPAKSLSRFADIISLCVQPEPEFRPPMSEVVQALVRLVQRASMIKRHSRDDLGFSYKILEHDPPTPTDAPF
uniref:Protein STRUBBELIG-RECEPTOR FAMILY 8 n=1 Tax=Anthurium amnicola TaxID=1678845 RepID=A0A1D1Z922_9ARAE